MSTLGWMFGKTLAVAIAKAWLGDGVAKDLFANVVDWGIGKAQKWGEPTVTEATLYQVAKNLQPLFEHEGRSLDSDAREMIVRAIGETVAKFDGNLAVQHNLNGETLAKQLIAETPNTTRDFSRDEESLYFRMLAEICSALVKISPKLPDFEYEWSASVLKDQDLLITLVNRLMEKPIEADVRFETKYRQAVCDQLDRVDFLGTGKVDDITRRQSLSVAYVPLSADLKNSSHIKKTAGLVGESDSSQNLSSGEIGEILKQGNRFIFYGDAGSGKTTLLHWLAVRASKKDFKDSLTDWNNLVPFAVHLREYAKKETGFPRPEEFPNEVADMLVGSMPQDWVHRQLESGNALVLIDGVDEVHKEQRPKILERIKNLVKLYPFTTYCISSRPSAINDKQESDWQDWIKESGFLDVSFKPMNLQQMEVMIKRWHLAISLAHLEKESEAGVLAEKLIAILHRRSELQRLAESPLLCVMLCALHHDRRDNLPSERRQLYRECIELLLERRDVKRAIAVDILPINLEAKLKILRSLAYWMLDNQQSRVDIEEIDKKFSTLLRSLPKAKGLSGEVARNFFVERANLLREPVIGQIEFVHRSFQEYLAAQHAVIDERNFGVLVQRATDDQWRDVVILAIGETTNQKDKNKLVKSLLKRAETEPPYYRNRIHLVIAVGLEQSIESISKELEKQLIAGLERVVPPLLNGEVELMASAGDRSVQLLSPKPDYDEMKVVACIETLSRIGSNAALNKLEEFGNDDRLKVRFALSEAWNMFDRREYAKRVLSKSEILYNPAFLDSSDGFEFLQHLKDLRVSFTEEVNDISSITSCSDLITLGLAWKRLGSLEFISNFPELRKLSLGMWQLPAYLHIVDNSIENISPLSKLKNLTHLDLIADDLFDLSPLNELSALTSLVLLGHKINNFDVFRDLKNLRELSIGILFLEAATNEDWVSKKNPWMLHNSIDTSPFSGLLNLERLAIGFSAIRSIESLQDMKQLKHLYLRKTKIKHLPPLQALTNLNSLIIFDTPLKDIGSLGGLKGLKRLEMNNIHIDNLAPLASLENLETLIIIDCDVTDLSALAELSSLKTLSISDVPAQTITIKKIDHPMNVHFRPNTGAPNYHIEELEPGLQVVETENGFEIKAENQDEENK